MADCEVMFMFLGGRECLQQCRSVRNGYDLVSSAQLPSLYPLFEAVKLAAWSGHVLSF